MKHKVSELEGRFLDAAVAQALGWGRESIEGIRLFPEPLEGRWSTNWSMGGPVIERERIMISPIREPVASDPPAGWCAMHVVAGQYIPGSTPLIAAMRAYVASKLGEEVELQ